MFRGFVYFVVLLLFALEMTAFADDVPIKTLSNFNLIAANPSKCQGLADGSIRPGSINLLQVGVPSHALPPPSQAQDQLLIQGPGNRSPEWTVFPHAWIRISAAPFDFRLGAHAQPLELLRPEGAEPLKQLANAIALAQNFENTASRGRAQFGRIKRGDSLILAGDDRVHRLIVLQGEGSETLFCFDEQSRRYVLLTDQDLENRSVVWFSPQPPAFEESVREAISRLASFSFPAEFSQRFSLADLITEVIENQRLGYNWIPLLNLGAGAEDMLIQVFKPGDEIRVLNRQGTWQNLIFTGKENGVHRYLSPNLLLVLEGSVFPVRAGYSGDALPLLFESAVPNTLFYRRARAAGR